MTGRQSAWLTAIGLLGWLLVASCGGGGGDGASGTDSSGPGADAGGTPGDSAGTTDAAGGGTDIPTSCNGPCYQVLFDDDEPIEVSNRNTRRITLRIVDFRAQTPAAGVPIALRLTGPADGTSTLDTESVTSDADGAAAVVLDAREDAPPISYLLIASAPGSADASIEVNVVPGATGSLRVTLAYGGSLPLGEVVVRLLAGGPSCGEVDATALPETGVAQTLPTVSSTATFEGLAADISHTVIGVARVPGAGGTRLGVFGCESLRATAGVETQLVLDLLDLPIAPAGDYDASMDVDLGRALPASAFEALDTFATRAAGDDVYGDLARRMRAAHSASRANPASPANLDAFEAALVAAFAGWRDAALPTWLAEAPFADDVALVLSATSLRGSLGLSQDPGTPFANASVEWTALSLPTDPSCTTDECATRLFSGAELASATPPVAIGTVTWTATVTDGDRMSVASHRAPIDMGALSRLVLDRVLLDATDIPAGGIAAGVAAWPDCSAVAARVAPAALAPLSIDTGGVATLCRQVADAELGGVLDTLQEMSDGGALRLQGAAVLQDDDDDLVADAIVDGIVTGFAQDEDDADLGPFSGTWRATRR